MTGRERLLDQLRPAAFAIAYRMLGSVAEAEDVVQEALLRETARAYLVVLEAVGIELAGQAPYDAELAERAVPGVLGLPSTPISTAPPSVGVSRPPAHADMEVHE
jgi:sigma-70-like protein